jgi:hypothetical protein
LTDWYATRCARVVFSSNQTWKAAARPDLASRASRPRDRPERWTSDHPGKAERASWERQSAESGRFGGESFERVGSRTDLWIATHLRMRDKQEVMGGHII